MRSSLHHVESFTVACRVSSCGTQAELLHCMWDLHPQTGIKPVSPTLQGRFSTTGPPGKSTFSLLTDLLFLFLAINKISLPDVHSSKNTKILPKSYAYLYLPNSCTFIVFSLFFPEPTSCIYSIVWQTFFGTSIQHTDRQFGMANKGTALESMWWIKVRTQWCYWKECVGLADCYSKANK